jgi:archaellum component FlaC
MLIPQRLMGLTAFLLGAIGLLVCLAGFAGVWIAGARLQQVNADVFRGADEMVTLADRRVEQAQGAVGGTRDIADKLKESWQASAKELLAERATSLPEIEDLERRLASSMERADTLLEASASITEMLEQVLNHVGVDANEGRVDPKSIAALNDTLQSTRKALAGANERFTEVQQRVAELREGGNGDVSRELVEELTLGIVARLDVVQNQLASFRHRLDGVKSRLAQARDTMRSWIVAGQCVMVFLLCWIGAGQYCLLCQGWRYVRRQPAV